jgi:hypothetical protein
MRMDELGMGRFQRQETCSAKKVFSQRFYCGSPLSQGIDPTTRLHSSCAGGVDHHIQGGTLSRSRLL